MLRICGHLTKMYTRRKRKCEQERVDATSRAARVVQRLWRRKDPILCKVIKKPFWIFRGDSAFCFDANVLYDYVANEVDHTDIFTRQPYTRSELFALAFLARMPHLSPETIIAQRVDIGVQREIIVAMETEVVDAVRQVAQGFPRHAEHSSRKLLEAMGDLGALGGLAHAHFFLTHAIEQHRPSLGRDHFRYFSAEVRTLCIVALLQNQI